MTRRRRLMTLVHNVHRVVQKEGEPKGNESGDRNDDVVLLDLSDELLLVNNRSLDSIELCTKRRLMQLHLTAAKRQLRERDENIKV